MANFTEQFVNNTSQFFQRLSLGRKILLILSLVLLLTTIIILFVWSNKPSYVTLFSNLSEKDAGIVLQKLQEKNIPYQVSEHGNAILVPANIAREIRLELAKEGLPASSVVGYELFDKNNLGMTDFVQKLNYRRALEGELARTIEQIDGVEKARVHIVIPEKSLFLEDQKPTTASVTLKLNQGKALTENYIQAIVHLVSSSVEGLSPENVTVVDTRGRILSNLNQSSDVIAMSSNQLQFTTRVEDYLTKKAQSMLDNILGTGNAIVRVNASLDFSKIEEKMELYDPDNTVVRSEEIDESTTPSAVITGNGQETTNLPSKSTTTITNYEISRTLRNIINEVGSIKKLTVAVVVNKKPTIVEKDGKKETIWVERSPQEIQTITELVKNAVGFNPERKDQITVQNIEFSNEFEEEPFGLPTSPTGWIPTILNYLKYALIVALIIGSILIIRSIMNVVSIKPDILPEPLKELELKYAVSRGELPHGKKELVPTGEKPKIPVVKPIEEELSEEVLAKSEFRAKIRDYVSQKPEEAVKLLRVWLHEEEE